MRISTETLEAIARENQRRIDEGKAECLGCCDRGYALAFKKDMKLKVVACSCKKGTEFICDNGEEYVWA